METPFIAQFTTSYISLGVQFDSPAALYSAIRSDILYLMLFGLGGQAYIAGLGKELL